MQEHCQHFVKEDIKKYNKEKLFDEEKCLKILTRNTIFRANFFFWLPKPFLLQFFARALSLSDGQYKTGQALKRNQQFFGEGNFEKKKISYLLFLCSLSTT